jgi:hypothetical protein
MSVRGKVAVELAVIGTLATVFIVTFPKRNPLVDIALACFALGCLWLSAGYTKKVVWGATPPPVSENRTRRCVVVTFWLTASAVILLFTIGGFIAFHDGGWPAVMGRVFNRRIPLAFCCYLPWALVQQTLLQFYLLGRLLVLFPRRFLFLPFAITGTCFGLVHLPDVWTAFVTVVAGTVWSFLYYRYRLLLPLSFSHAALGTAFYYGIFGHDLAVEWRALLP